MLYVRMMEDLELAVGFRYVCAQSLQLFNVSLIDVVYHGARLLRDVHRVPALGNGHYSKDRASNIHLHNSDDLGCMSNCTLSLYPRELC